MKLPVELIAVLNAETDRIASVKIGDGLTVALETGLSVCTVVQKNGTTITLQKDLTVPGIQRDETLFYPNRTGETIEVALCEWTDQGGVQRRGWKHASGGSVYLGRYPIIG